MALNVYDKVLIRGQPKVLVPENVWRDVVYTGGYERFELTTDFLPPVQQYDSRAEAIAATIDSRAAMVWIGGYNAPGDRGNGLYKEVVTPSVTKLWNFQSADGSWWELVPDIEVRVQQFGARGDVVTNDLGQFVSAGTVDQAAFVAAVEFSRLKGCDIHVPAGKYRLNADLLIDCSDDPVGTMWPTKYRPKIRGDGERATFLFWDAGIDVDGIKYIGRGSATGNNPGLEHVSQNILTDMTLVKKAGQQGVGLSLVDHFRCVAKNVSLLQWNTGLFFQDVHLSTFENVKSMYGVNAFFVQKANDTQPNAITFRGCDFSNNLANGGDLLNVSGILFDGCDFASNGFTFQGQTPAPNTTKWGVRIRYDAAPIEGVVAVNFLNCRFEGNISPNFADIYYVNAFYDAIVNVIGCDFLRDGDFGGANPRYAKNNILMDGQGTATHILNLFGSAFTGFNSYYPTLADPLRQYVWVTDLTKDVRVNEHGCHFENDIEFPVTVFTTNGNTRLLQNSARAFLADTVGGIIGGVNVLSVVKTGTGLYRVTFRQPMINDFYHTNFTSIGGAIEHHSITLQDKTGFTVQFWNAAGAATDTRFSFEVSGGARI